MKKVPGSHIVQGTLFSDCWNCFQIISIVIVMVYNKVFSIYLSNRIKILCLTFMPSGLCGFLHPLHLHSVQGLHST